MRPDSWRRGALLAACMTLAMAAPALAQKSADTLRITWRDAIPDVDPYYNSQRTGMVVAFHAFDCLVYRDPVTMEMKPALATSWKQVDATTIGTGPYKITNVDGTTEIDMERYDGYYAGSPKGRPAIRYIKIHEVPDATTELTELLGGKADWIWGYNADQFANIARMPNLNSVRFGTMRVHFVTIDAAGRSGADNPLTKLKVRQAVISAIDRATMAKQLIQGDSQVIDTPCFPSQFGCDVAAAVKYPYDPARAKQLLTEAGYPNGFDTELVSYATPQVGAAVQNYLKAVGINLRIQQLQIGAAIQLAEAGKAPLYSGSWGSNSVNDASAFMPYWLGGGLNDYARDADVQNLLKQAGASVDPELRRKAFGKAIHLATERVDFVPLFSDVRYVAFSKQLNFQGYPDDVPRFYLSSWK